MSRACGFLLFPIGEIYIIFVQISLAGRLLSEAQSLNKNIVLRSEEFTFKSTAHIWAFEGRR